MRSDIESLFGVSSEDDKLEAFDQSTAKLILRALGQTAAQVAGLAKDLQDGLTCDYVNRMYTLPMPIYAHRIFSFNLTQVLKTPKKDPLVRGLVEFVKGLPADYADYTERMAVVFKAYEIGRMVAVFYRDPPPVMLEHTGVTIRVMFPDNAWLLAELMLWSTFTGLVFDNPDETEPPF